MKEIDQEQQEHIITRPPIVVVMGHIDHGKTTILDWYRNARVVESEAGGITQHIGAYEVKYGNKTITFIDTPGHEAFSKIRSRGAHIADIAILVVAADEGVKLQTKEAINIIIQSHTPFIVVFNKIDKPEANPERVKQELARENVLVESYGGKIPSIEVSAHKGTNMDTLLETILLLSELEELKADTKKNANGVVLETHRDPKRGISATLLVQDGTLKRHDIIVVGRIIETVKILEDFLGNHTDCAGPSAPVVVAGLSQIPIAGEIFHAFSSKPQAQEYISKLPPLIIEKTKTPGTVSIEETERPIFNIILKTDVVGSKEALEESLIKLESEHIRISIIRSEVGNINEDDVKFATATRLVTIVGFKVRVDPSVRELAQKQNIHMATGEVIYHLLDEVKKQMQEILPPIIQHTTLGKVQILKIFKQDSKKQVIGGHVEEGIIRKGGIFDVIRNKELIGKGTIAQLQRDKRDTDNVSQGTECGILVDSPISIREGDRLEVSIEEHIKRIL